MAKSNALESATTQADSMSGGVATETAKPTGKDGAHVSSPPWKAVTSVLSGLWPKRNKGNTGSGGSSKGREKRAKRRDASGASSSSATPSGEVSSGLGARLSQRRLTKGPVEQKVGDGASKLRDSRTSSSVGDASGDSPVLRPEEPGTECDQCSVHEAVITFSRCGHNLCRWCASLTLVSDPQAGSNGDVCAQGMRETPRCGRDGGCREPLAPVEVSEIVSLRALDTVAMPLLARFWQQAKDKIHDDVAEQKASESCSPQLVDKEQLHKAAVHLVVRNLDRSRRCLGCDGLISGGSADGADRFHCASARALGCLQLMSGLATLCGLPKVNDVMNKALENRNSSIQAAESCYREEWEDALHTFKESLEELSVTVDDREDDRMATLLWLLLPYVQCDEDGLETWPPFLSILLGSLGYISVLEHVVRGACGSKSVENDFVAAVVSIGSVSQNPVLRDTFSAELHSLSSCVECAARDEELSARLRQLPGATDAVERVRGLLSPTSGGELSVGDAAADRSTKFYLQLLETPDSTLEARYQSQLQPLQFDTVAGLSSSFSFHKEAAGMSRALASPNAWLRNRNKRLIQEVTALSTSLPLSLQSSIAVRVDEDRYDCMQAAIFGPEGTPYASGVFVFDLFLPHDFPTRPPLVKHLTTSGGRVRFNPNLYADGKVCLSLIGTWSGPGWTTASTVLQVLVSIQSLVLTSKPLFNEPAFEKDAGVPGWESQSRRYNTKVHTKTVLVGLRDVAEAPPLWLRDVVLAHLRLKHGRIVGAARDWLVEARKVEREVAGRASLRNRARNAMLSVVGVADPTPEQLLQAADVCALEVSLQTLALRGFR